MNGNNFFNMSQKELLNFRSHKKFHISTSSRIAKLWDQKQAQKPHLIMHVKSTIFSAVIIILNSQYLSTPLFGKALLYLSSQNNVVAALNLTRLECIVVVVVRQTETRCSDTQHNVFVKHIIIMLLHIFILTKRE